MENGKALMRVTETLEKSPNGRQVETRPSRRRIAFEIDQALEPITRFKCSLNRCSYRQWNLPTHSLQKATKGGPQKRTAPW